MNIKKPSFVLSMLLVVGLWAVPSIATEQHEDPTEASVREIAKTLRCAVCQNQSIYESNSDLAKDMLSVIRTKVAAGEPESAIRDYFFQRYGDYIYLEPTAQGGNRLLWIGPFIALILGALALFSALKKWQPSQSRPPEVDKDAFRNRLKSEMDKID
ncbi:MAG: cytochrome c-type biogenesis protein CcmH [Magnetococcales bacterium]|nr:cytochrome c-type biogenesis protein CcmH [Magnetococcales bacterium]MBF0151791.1 cytochrome c-type biogenesis protein CcmH [Magnetococcales bacterium]MBF0174664.1 cytochrome c-type biogenesis protein CcmH [Magnetococcales bacterium]MBF0348378.1 cytochrome c-type biogenesis protein CcmH [Magnetococcales bacterium]